MNAVALQDAARELFSEHLDLAPLGQRTRGLVRCRFHEGDTTPSLSVDLERGLFHCFSCKVGGGVKRFAELVGVAPAIVMPATGPERTPLQQARAEVLADERRQLEKLAPYLGPDGIYAAADAIREDRRWVDELRGLATKCGDTAAGWAIAERAARHECEILQREAELEARIHLVERPARVRKAA